MRGGSLRRVCELARKAPHTELRDSVQHGSHWSCHHSWAKANVSDILEDYDKKMRDAENESHEGKRKVESLWLVDGDANQTAVR